MLLLAAPLVGNQYMYIIRMVFRSMQNGSEAEICTVYTGSVCFDQLLSLQNCIPGRQGSQVVYISSDVDQTATENQVMLIQGSLSILSPSTECLDAVDPFLCLYYFGLCDSSGNVLEPSEETCVAISTDTCQSNFIPFPTCVKFGKQLITCNGMCLDWDSSCIYCHVMMFNNFSLL